jgi:putative tricarboxylic transport membrane protein
VTSFRFSDRTVALVVAACGAGYLALALRLPDAEGVAQTVQPATLPIWLGALLLLLAAILFLRPRPAYGRDAPETTSEEADPPQESGATAAETAPRARPWVFGAAMGGYIALFVPLGFLLSTVLFLIATIWYLGFPRHLVNVAISTATAGALYFGIGQGLGVVLPPGPLPW